jgi:uncharacterized membrane protein YkoI
MPSRRSTALTIPFLLVLSMLASYPAVAGERSANGVQRSPYIRLASGVMSLDEAVGMAQSRFRAKAVKAEVANEDGRRVYYIRLLSPEGRVWTVSVDAATGKISNQ